MNACFYRYQKTESVIKSTAEKTTSILGGITAGMTTKIGQMRNSDSFRSIEERVGTAYENVKVTKILYIHLSLSEMILLFYQLFILL